MAVTGGTGFIGSHLVRRLLQQGHTVRVLARSPEKATKLLGPQVTVVAGDLTQPNSFPAFLQGVTTVFHLASLLQDAGTPNKVFWQVHVEATRQLLEASQRAGVKQFIHFSTIGVLGAPQQLPANEESPYQASDIYQITKCEGEKLALQAFQQNKIKGCVIRPTAVYGPGDQRLLKLFKTIAQRKFRMIGNGNIFIHPVHVEDVVSGSVLAAQKKESHAQIYILGGDHAVPLKTFVALIANALGVSLKSSHIPYWPVWFAAAFCEILCKPLRIQPPLYRRRVDFFAKSRSFDISKAKRELGYAPRYSLEQGLGETCQWYCNQGWIK